MEDQYLEPYRKHMVNVYRILIGKGLSKRDIGMLQVGIITGAAWEQDQTRAIDPETLADELLEYLNEAGLVKRELKN